MDVDEQTVPAKAVPEQAVPAELAHIAEEATDAVRRWLATPREVESASEARLSRLVAAPGGVDAARGIVHGTLRPQNSWTIGRDGFTRFFSHLFLRLDVRELKDHLVELTSRGGIRPSLAPVATGASGQHEANRQAEDVRDLLLRDDVESVSFSLSSVVGSWRLIDLDGLVDEAIERVTPLFETAANEQHPKFIDLAACRFDELEPTLRVFERMLQRYPQLDVGIALPASLPDSLPALRRVAEAARTRQARGGAPATVRIVRGEGSTDEHAAAEVHGWASAAFATVAESRAHYIRLLNFALHPGHSRSLRVISATPDLFATAFAWRLARARGVERTLEHEFRLGVATKTVDVVKRDVGGVRISAPVLHGGQLPLAAGYLYRRLNELSDTDGMFAVSGTLTGEAVILREEGRFLGALENSLQPAVSTLRRQDLLRAEVADFTNSTTRQWALGVLERARDSAAGEALLARSAIETPSALEVLVSGAVSSGESWGERRGSTRAAVLESVADTFAEWRGRLVEVAVSESGMLVEEADSEVTVAITLARNAARNARKLAAVTDARFVPPRLIVVVAPRSCALTSLAATVLSGLAAGGAVIVKAAPETRRSAAVFIETLIAGGVPAGLVSVVDAGGPLVRSLISDPRVDRVLHTGSRHTAKLFHSWRAETVLFSMTGGRNSFIVTPSADPEAAVADIVSSAFDHAGQAPTSTGTVILVGSVGESARFLGRLTDAVASVPTGMPGRPGAGISALSKSAGKREHDALDSLADGERWLVRPRQRDRDGRLWSPGLRDGVAPESLFRRQERRAPVLDIVRVPTLAEAIAAQNAPGFGLSAGIHSLDSLEVETWLGSVQAGVLCVNRPVVSGVGSRVPIGGWNRSVLGAGRAAGGPDAVLALGTWKPADSTPGTTVTLDGVGDEVARFIAAAQPGMSFTEFDWVRAGSRSDQVAWKSAFSLRELTSGEFERNVQRYRTLSVTIRLSEGAPLVQLVRVLAAAAIAGAPVAVSSARPLHPGLIALFGESDSPVDVAQVLIESDTRWRARVQAGEIVTTRIRLIGGDETVLARVLHGQPGIAVYAGPVTTSGRIELLSFVREQSISINLNRVGPRDTYLQSLPTE